MAVQWGSLPVDVLISIFCYLKRRDRLACSMVCTKWNYAMGAPNLWRHVAIYLDTDLMEPSTMILTREYHMFIRSIEFGWSKPQMPTRWLPHKLQEITKRACRYLIMLTEKYVQVGAVKLHAWYELTRLKKIVYHLSLFLKSQINLTHLCFCNALLNKSDFIKLFVACRNSEDVVAQLDIRSCFYHFEMNLFSVQFIGCMERFSNLSLLKVDYSTFRREVKQVLLGGKNKKLRRLEIYAQNDDVIPISDEEWWELSRQLQGLNVALNFTNVVNTDGVLSVLQKSIPLQSFSLMTSKCWHNHNHNGCRELLRILTKFYKRTLEFLDVRFHDNIDLPDEMLLGVVRECKKLKSFRFSGVVGDPDVLREMCKIQVEQNVCKHVEVAVRHMNSEAHLSVLKLHEELEKYRRDGRINFRMHNTKFRNLLSHTEDFKSHLWTHTGDKPFKCTICNYQCGRALDLKRHVRTHGEKPLKCNACAYSCNLDKQLKKHMMTHGGEKPFKCALCDYSCLYASILRKHAKVHSGEMPFKCDACDYRCNYSCYLKKHMMKHSGEKPFKCAVCDYACAVPSNLTSHMKTHSDEKEFKCDFCDYSCNHSSSLKAHLLTHTSDKPFRCDICGDGFRWPQGLKSHLSTHTDEKPFECDVCDYKCKKRAQLKTHSRRHANQKLFKCIYCDHECFHVEILKEHGTGHCKTNRESGNAFRCATCDYEGTNSGNLKRHVSIVHGREDDGGDKLFKCVICDYHVARTSDLRRHVLIHSAEKQFKCIKCDYRCNYAKDLKAHMMIHTGDKPFKCTLCDYESVQASRLKSHMKVHSDEKRFKCDLCGYSCKHSYSLKTHSSVHTGDKSLKCNFCDYRCRWSRSLHRHSLKHHDKPFKCDRCDFQSDYFAVLERHTLKHTDEKPPERKKRQKKT